MAKIDFGYNNDAQLNSQFEGYIATGTFEGVIDYNGDAFLISKINGNLDVQEIAQDIYGDGSYSTYANQEKTAMCNTILMILNRPEIQKMMIEGLSLIESLRMGGLEVYPTNLRSVITGYENVPGIVTLVRAELFEDLKNTKRLNHSSYYELCKQIEILQMQLDQLKQTEDPGIKI